MTLSELALKESKLVIGLMSGTSADGIDAALVRIEGCGTATRAQLVAYTETPFDDTVRAAILRAAAGGEGGSRDLALLSALLGQLYLEACLAVCRAAGVRPNEIDLVGSHGQTVYHQPQPVEYLGRQVAATLQIGEVSPICEGLGAPVVSDFRVRDLAAGGQGAPLVPYTEYLLYRDDTADVALQNIGGIGNITFLPAGGALADLLAFDTGPGNMLIDAAAARLTGGKARYDAGGELAAAHPASPQLLAALMRDDYLKKPPPKTTGREHYGAAFIAAVYEKAAALGLSDGQVLRTLTRYTAETIAHAVRTFLPAMPARLLVGGGGARNHTLMADLRAALPEARVATHEEHGMNGDAKEAVAFALLANEAVHARCNNAPAATGAAHPVVMGKISQ